MPTPFSVDRVFLINLLRRRDRLTEASANILSSGWPFPVPEIMPGIDGSTVTGLSDDWSKRPGAWCCRESHANCLRAAQAAGNQAILILEDDVCFVPDFREQLAATVAAMPADWEAIMLGGQHVRAPERINADVVRCTAVVRTHAYILRASIIQTVLNSWRGNEECDIALAGLMRWRRFYAPRLFLAGTFPSPSDIAGGTVVSKVMFWNKRPDPPPAVPFSGRASGNHHFPIST